MAKVIHNTNILKDGSNTDHGNTKKIKMCSSEAFKDHMWQEYLELSTMKKIPFTHETLERMAMTLVEWVKRKDSYKLNSFFHQFNVNSRTFYSWTYKCENLAEAHKFALEVIGTRRELGGLHKELDSGIVKHTMPHYDSDWKELEKWRSSLRISENESEKEKIVVIEKFSATPEEVAGKIRRKTAKRAHESYSGQQ